MNELIAPRAFTDTLKDLKDHAPTTLFSAALLTIPLPLAALARAFIPGSLGLLAAGAFQILGLLTVGVWLRALLIRTTVAYATGESPDVPAALETSLRGGAFFRLLGVNLVIGAMYIAAALLLIIPVFGVVAATLGGGGWSLQALMNPKTAATLLIALVFGLGLFMPVAFVIFMRYTLARAVTVVEEKGVIASLSRSRELMKGRWPDFALLALILMVVGAALTAVVNGPAIFVQMSAPAPTPTVPNLTVLLRGGVDTLPFPLAMVIAISTWLSAIIGTSLITAARANFFIGLKGQEPFTPQSSSTQESSRSPTEEEPPQV